MINKCEWSRARGSHAHHTARAHFTDDVVASGHEPLWHSAFFSCSNHLSKEHCSRAGLTFQCNLAFLFCLIMFCILWLSQCICFARTWMMMSFFYSLFFMFSLLWELACDLPLLLSALDIKAFLSYQTHQCIFFFLLRYEPNRWFGHSEWSHYHSNKFDLCWQPRIRLPHCTESSFNMLSVQKTTSICKATLGIDSLNVQLFSIPKGKKGVRHIEALSNMLSSIWRFNKNILKKHYTGSFDMFWETAPNTYGLSCKNIHTSITFIQKILSKHTIMVKQSQSLKVYWFNF